MADESLTPDHPSAAYQCGRLLAVIDRVQQLAISPKATLVDRFYGSASSTPAAVYGALLRKTQVHLGKLRKEKPGLYVTLDRSLAEIMGHLTSFPRTLTLEDQALFALGFYQQKQHRATKPEADADVSVAG